MKSVISSARNKMQELMKTNGTLKNENATLSSDIAALKIENAELKSKMSETNEGIFIIFNLSEVVKLSLTDGSMSIAALRVEHDEVVNQLKKEIADLKAQLEHSKHDSLVN